MSDLQTAAPVPARGRTRRRPTSLPILGAIFVGLFAIAGVARLAGISGPRVALPGGLGSWMLDVLSIDLVIVLPAVVLARSPDAATGLRWVFRGPVLLALATFLRSAVSALVRLLPGLVGADALTGAPGAGAFLMSAVVSMIGAIGIVVLAFGLWPATRPTTTVRLLVAGLVALAIVLAVGIQATAVLVGSPPWNSVVAGDVGSAVALTLSCVAGYLQAIAWAPLAWVLVRLAADEWSPARVVGAAVAVITAAYFWVTTVSVIAAGSISSIGSILTIGSTLLALASSVLLVAAFALGLAETARPPVVTARARPERRMPKYRRRA